MNTENKNLDIQDVLNLITGLKGDKLTSSWRPLLALVLGIVVLNNYMLSPYISLFVDKLPIIPLDDKFWIIATPFLTAYAGGRSVEKIMKIRKEN